MTAWYCKSRLNQQSSKGLQCKSLSDWWRASGADRLQPSGKNTGTITISPLCLRLLFFSPVFHTKGCLWAFCFYLLTKIICKGSPGDSERSQHFPETSEVRLDRLQASWDFSLFRSLFTHFLSSCKGISLRCNINLSFKINLAQKGQTRYPISISECLIQSREVL